MFAFKPGDLLPNLGKTVPPTELLEGTRFLLKVQLHEVSGFLELRVLLGGCGLRLVGVRCRFDRRRVLHMDVTAVYEVCGQWLELLWWCNFFLILHPRLR